MFTTQIRIQVQFYDTDSMQIVWHGNYAKYFERARCALLDKIGYNYLDMAQDGLAMPIVDMRTKYIKPARFNQWLNVDATLIEYENRLKIDYLITDVETGEVLTKSTTIQLTIKADTGELLFFSPDRLIALCSKAA